MGMQNPQAMTSAQIAASGPGTKVYLVARIDGIRRTMANAEILDPIGNSTSAYRDSHVKLALYVPNDLPVIMGARKDLKPGAIVFVYGVTTGKGRADATKAVVITPYAHITS